MSRHFIPTLLSVRMEGWRSLTSVTTRLLPCVFRLVKSASSSWPLTSLLFFCCFCGFLAATVRPPSLSNLIFYSFNKLSPSFPPSVLSPLLSSYTSTLFGLSFPFLPPDSFIPLFLFIQQEPFLIPFLVVLSSFLLPHLSFTTHTTDTHTHTAFLCCLFYFFNLLCFMKTLIFAFTILAVILLYLSFTLNLLVKLIIISQHCVTLKEMTNPVDTMCWRGKQVKVWRVDLWNRTVNRDHSGLVPSPQLPVNYLRVCSSPNYFFNTSIIFYYSSFASYRIILMFSW